MAREISNILIVDDQPLFSEAVLESLLMVNHFKNVISVTNIPDAKASIGQLQPEVVLLDLNLGEKSGFDLLHYINNDYKKQVKVIILTVRRDQMAILKAYRMKADGFLDKTCSLAELTQAIDTVVDGQSYYNEVARQIITEGEDLGEMFNAEMLSPREKEVLALIAQSLTSKEIAEKLSISFNTVNVHRKNLLHKFGVSNTSGLVKMAIENGII